MSGRVLVGALVFASSAAILALTSVAIHYGNQHLGSSSFFSNIINQLNQIKPMRDTVFACSLAGAIGGHLLITSGAIRFARRTQPVANNELEKAKAQL